MIHSAESFHPNPDNLRAIQDVGRQVAPDTSELAKRCSGFIAGNSLRISYEDNSIVLMVFNELFEHLRINLITTFEELRLFPSMRPFLSFVIRKPA
jgi:hypothetical protein